MGERLAVPAGEHRAACKGSNHPGDLTERLGVCKVLMTTPVVFHDIAGALLKGFLLLKNKIKNQNKPPKNKK